MVLPGSNIVSMKTEKSTHARRKKGKRNKDERLIDFNKYFSQVNFYVVLFSTFLCIFYEFKILIYCSRAYSFCQKIGNILLSNYLLLISRKFRVDLGMFVRLCGFKFGKNIGNSCTQLDSESEINC